MFGSMNSIINKEPNYIKQRNALSFVLNQTMTLLEQFSSSLELPAGLSVIGSDQQKQACFESVLNHCQHLQVQYANIESNSRRYSTDINNRRFEFWKIYSG